MKAILLAVITGAVVAAPAAELPTLKFAGGAADLQALLDKAPEGTVVMCEQTGPLTVTKTLTIAKPIALRGLKARLPENLGDTVLLVVAAKGVTLTDLELHGNYDSVPQKSRAPLIHIKAGEFQVERCKFFDGSKDGIMVTPDDGTGDIVGGVVRNIEGTRMGRDVVSLSGGCGGQRIRNVTVENIRLKKGYYRGAVEVSDGSDNVTVRHVHAEDAVYAIDVQDHGARQPGKPAPSAPNTNITLEDVTAVNCKHILRTANHDLGHSHLTLRDFTGRDCQEPVLISNTKHVRLENLTLSNDPAAKKPRITLRNCEDVQLRNVTIVGLREGREAVATPNSTDVRIEGLKRSNTEAPAKVAQPSFPAIEAEPLGSVPEGAVVLHADWQMRESAMAGDDGAAISEPGLHANGWYRTSVPTTALGTLVRHGVYPDIYDWPSYKKSAVAFSFDL